MQYLVLLSHGREIEYRRAIFATLSFWARHPAPASTVRTLIFTDCPAYFQPYLAGLPVDYVLLTTAHMAEMRGSLDFLHRIKIGILEQAQRTHPGADLLYVDSDTFFVADPVPLLQLLTAGVALMHLPEFTFEQAIKIYADFGQAEFPRKFVELIERRSFVVGGAERRFQRSQYCWNAGVLGLPKTAAALLPDVYALTDTFCAETGWFTSEQLAFSLVLQAQLPLQASDRYVFHYWGQRQKQLMDALLAQLLTQPFSQLSSADRLAMVRPLTRSWHRQVELDRVREGSLYAFGKGQLLAGIKCAVKALLRDPFDRAFPRQLWQALRHRTGARAVSKNAA